MSEAEVVHIRSTPRKSAQGSDFGRSVRIALDVLECFATDEQLGVTDVAARVGVAKSTAHRMLTVLVERGYAERVAGSGKYQLGIHLYEMGQLAQSRHRLRRVALPVLRRIQSMTGLIVTLSVPEGADVVFVERLELPSLQHLVAHLGRRLPAHTTSSGKAMAAHNSTLDAARREAGFPPRVSRTVRSSADWAREVEFVRTHGYARSSSESVDELATVAVPLVDWSGTANAAMSVMGPWDRVAQEEGLLARILRTEARRIMTEL